eukprot:5912841-Amphidinium_carterae.1
MGCGMNTRSEHKPNNTWDTNFVLLQPPSMIAKTQASDGHQRSLIPYPPRGYALLLISLKIAKAQCCRGSSHLFDDAIVGVVSNAKPALCS